VGPNQRKGHERGELGRRAFDALAFEALAFDALALDRLA